MSFIRFDTMLGRWKIETKWGEYIVDVTEVCNYKGLMLSGPYTFNGETYSIGGFPMIDIKKMEKVS